MAAGFFTSAEVELVGACDSPALGLGVILFPGTSHHDECSILSILSRSFTLSLSKCFALFLPLSSCARQYRCACRSGAHADQWSAKTAIHTHRLSALCVGRTFALFVGRILAQTCCLWVEPSNCPQVAFSPCPPVAQLVTLSSNRYHDVCAAFVSIAPLGHVSSHRPQVVIVLSLHVLPPFQNLPQCKAVVVTTPYSVQSQIHLDTHEKHTLVCMTIDCTWQ